MLPIGVRFGRTLINYSTAELTRVGPEELRFRGSGAEEIVSLTSDVAVAAIDASGVRSGKAVTVRSRGGPFAITIR